MQVIVYDPVYETRRVCVPTHGSLDHRVMEYQFCMQNIQNPKGHYMEFGVFEGKSINYLASLN